MYDLLVRFGRDRGAAVAVMFGLSVMVLSGIVGIAVDQSKAYNVKTRLTAALEASALAAVKLLDADDDASDGEIKDLAETYFNARIANLGLPDVALSNFQAIPNRSDSEVETKVDVDMGTIFGRLMNIQPTLEFTPAATVAYRARKIELVLVLDITGSMATAGKLDALKTAAKQMVDTLYASNPMAGAVRVGMVPYSGSVNAGAYSWNISNGHGVHDDCVIERKGISVYSNAAPSSSSSKLEVLRPAADDDDDDHINLWAYNCPSAEIVPLTELSDSYQREDFKSKIDGLVAEGGTAGHIGLAMGWYMVSPEWGSIWPIAPRAYNPDNILKVVVFMTDGILNLSYLNGGEALAYGTPESVDSNTAGSSPYQTLRLCDNMTTAASTARKILLYTVAFQAPTDAETLLKSCSGNENFYTADTAGELNTAFQQIVDNLNSMALVN